MTGLLENIPSPISYAAGAALIFGFLSVMVLVLTWLERKALARIQQRMGPMRVGPHGTLQPIADALKLMTKEDILPSWADRRVYWLAPLAVSSVTPALGHHPHDQILSSGTWTGPLLHHGLLRPDCVGPRHGRMGLGK